MEGKAVLFKQFADIDVFDIEIEERDPEKFIETVARLLRDVPPTPDPGAGAPASERPAFS